MIANRLPGRQSEAPHFAIQYGGHPTTEWTPTGDARKIRAMRRTRHDVLASSPNPRFVVLWGLNWTLIDCERLAPRTDIRAAWNRALERQRQHGWMPEDRGDFGFVFLSGVGGRRLLMMTEREPGDPTRQSFTPFAG